MAFPQSDRTPELNSILVRQGRNRILSALKETGAHVYSAVTFSTLAATYHQLYKKELNEFEFYHYFDLKDFGDVIGIHLADVLDFEVPIKHEDPVLLVLSGVEMEKRPNVRLRTNVKFLGSPPISNVLHSPGHTRKTWVNSHLKAQVTPPRPQHPPTGNVHEYTVERSPPMLTMNDCRDHYLPVSPPKVPDWPVSSNPMTHPNHEGQFRSSFWSAPNNTTSPSRRLFRRYDSPDSSPKPLNIYPSPGATVVPNNRQQRPESESRPLKPSSQPPVSNVPVRRFTKPIVPSSPLKVDENAEVPGQNDTKQARDAPVNHVSAPVPSAIRPSTTGHTTPTKLSGSNAVPMGSRFTKRIDPPAPAVVTVPDSNDNNVVSVEDSSKVPSSVPIVAKAPVKKGTKLLKKKKSIKRVSTVNGDSLTGSEESNLPPPNEQPDDDAASWIHSFQKLSLDDDQDGDDELTDPRPTPTKSPMSSEPQRVPSPEVTSTKPEITPAPTKPVPTTTAPVEQKSPSRSFAQSALSHFIPRQLPTLNNITGNHPLLIRSRNRSPSEFSVISQQVVPFPAKKKPVYTTSAHKGEAVYTDDDE